MQAVENKILDPVMLDLFATPNLGYTNIVFLDVVGFLLNDLLYKSGFVQKGIHNREIWANVRIAERVNADGSNDIFRNHCSETLLNEYEREFDDRMLALNKDLPRKNRHKGLFGKLLSMWSLSLCSLASMGNGNANDEGGLFGMNLFE